jgi:hypothetical protein
MHNQILNGMARAFFACAWADQCEGSDNAGIMSGRDIMALMPSEIDPAAIHAADTLAIGFISANILPPISPVATNQGLRVLYRKACELDPDGADRELTPELFGHYLAMQAMGTGVGLESFGYAVRDFFNVPYVEFGGCSLEKDYF